MDRRLDKDKETMKRSHIPRHLVAPTPATPTSFPPLPPLPSTTTTTLTPTSTYLSTDTLPSTPPPHISTPSPISPFTVDKVYLPSRYPPSASSTSTHTTKSPVTPSSELALTTPSMVPYDARDKERDRTGDRAKDSQRERTLSDSVHRRLSFGPDLAVSAVPSSTLATPMSDRLPVDPSIKGIPQGWEDDFSVLPTAASSSAPLRRLNSEQPQYRTLTSNPNINPNPNPNPSSNPGSTLGPSAHMGNVRRLPPATDLPTGSRPALPNPNASPVRPPLASAASRLREGTSRIKLASFSAIRSRGPRRTASIGYGYGVNPRDLAGEPCGPSTQATLRTVYPNLTSGVSKDSSSFDDTSSVASPAPPHSATESVNSATDFADLFAGGQHPQPSGTSITSVHGYEPSESSTPSRSSKRDRVLGIRQDGPLPTQSKIFLPPNINDVLPFATTRPFAAWDADAAAAEVGGGGNMSVNNGAAGATKPRRLSVSFGSTTSYQSPSADTRSVGSEGWKKLPRPRGGGGGKKVWVDETGVEMGGVYKVGWESQVLDLEARLHETMYDLAGERHTFTSFPPGDEPRNVLDLGTGIGLWPISQALAWPEAKFVAVDLVPCQMDLAALAAAERTARSTTCATATGLGLWGSVEKRVSYERCSFLEHLPFDSGVFDMVHVRFVGLGVPESRWGDLIDEASRVLKPGGKLEIVETSYTLPSTAPASLRHSFNSLLLSDLIQPIPSLAIRLNLPSTVSLSSNLVPDFEQTWKNGTAPGALADAASVWVRSALEYKGTGIVNKPGTKRKDSVIVRTKQELKKVDPKRWFTGEGEVEVPEVEGSVSVWAWVATKK